MKSASLPATPDRMTLLCIIGGAMRGEGNVFLGMELLLLGVMFPQFGWLVHEWLNHEEYYAARPGLRERQPGYGGEDACDDEDDSDSVLRSGWVRRGGDTWLWRNVTRALIVFVPVRWTEYCDQADFLPRRRRLGSALLLSGLFSKLFFKLDLGDTRNCALFVPGS